VTAALLEVRNLKTCFLIDGKEVPIVDGITFQLSRGEVVALVGESGCGKTVTALSLMNLIPDPPGKIKSGQIIFEEEDLLTKSESQLRKIRGNRISMIFQDPMMSLNPVQSIGRQISEALELHQGFSRKRGTDMAQTLLRLVGIPSPESLVKEYPHRLSGGMKQRVMIAMALSCNPGLMIADEPTTALDVTIQAQILEIMRNLRKNRGMAILLITHDLGIVAEIAERVLVMYAGRIVESAPVSRLFANPQHPYTKGLLAAVPRPETVGKRLHTIEGILPRPGDFLPGCRFHPRCEYAREICMKHEPFAREVGADSHVCCWLGTEKYSRIGMNRE
jgi:oligopeptide/dipeptide ABC transporter ATP-binding protein